MKRRRMRSYRFIDWASQGFLLVVALLLVLGHSRAPGVWPWMALAHLIVVFLLHGLIQAAGRSTASRPLKFLREYYPILLYTAFYRETELVNRLLQLPRLDPQLIRIEHALFGAQPSVDLMPSHPSPWLSGLLYSAYFSYYLMIAGLGLWLWFRRPTELRHFVAVVSFVFYACYLVYMVVPVVGPRLFFRDTPERALYVELYRQLPPGVPESVRSGVMFQVMALIYRNLEANSAAFPSSHVAVAVTTLWFSWRYVRPIRWVHAVTVGLLCLSTVYCRYHYVVDVPAGILAALILAPLGDWLYRRIDRPESVTAPSQAARS